MNFFRRMRRAGTSATPTPSPSPTPTPTPSATHNGTTPSAVAATVTNYAELVAAVATAAAAGTPQTIAVRGPAAGSAAGVYQSGGFLDLSGTTCAQQLTIRAADFNDKPILRGSNATAWVGLPRNCILDGFQFEDTSTADSLSGILYNADNHIIRRCYIRGSVLAAGAPYYGTTTGQRFASVRGGLGNVTIEYCVAYGIACLLYADGGATGLSVTDNSILNWGEHAVKGGGSINGLTVARNLFQRPKPGYNAGAYYNHANGMYFGGISADVIQNFDIDQNFFLSDVDLAHASFCRVSWGDDGDGGGAGTVPSPSNAKSIAIRRNKTRGGLPAAIAFNSATGAGNTIHDNDVRTCTSGGEITVNTTDVNSSTCSYYNNSGAYNFVSSTVDTSGGGNTNTSGLSITPAAALIEMTAWAAGGNPTGITMQTLATLGL